MGGLTDIPSPQAPGLGFTVSHQKVELDIDLLSCSLRGRTDLTINPHSKELRTLRLNCRQCEIKHINVNGRPAVSAPYLDPYKRSTLPWNATVHQYHMLRRKLEGQLKDSPEEELIVNLSKNFRIDELDPFSAEAQNVLVTRIGATKRESVDGNLAADLSQGARTGVEQTARFSSITLHIEYLIQKVRDGIQFVGWEKNDLRYPHAYSTNSLSPGSACCIFPCLDDRTSRCTWEISIKCSKSIGDAVNRLESPTLSSFASGSGALPNGSNCITFDDGHRFGFSEEDRALDLTVICTGDMTDEMVDPLDPTRKTTSFISTTPILARHIGFAIGPFEYVDLTEFRESDEDEKLGENAVTVHGFCLPGRVDETKNTCLPLAKAIDFFTLTYGSYPFTNFKLCFVDDISSEIVSTGSLSICSTRLLFPEEIIEPIEQVSRSLVHSLASQWMGINIAPKEPADTWVVVGIAYFITDMFMKKLAGNNDYRFRQRQASDRVTDLDVARPSLYDTGRILSLDPSELEFMTKKAPLVLFILDRRLTKAGGSSGLSRIISRLFLNAKVGEMANSAISTAYFTKTCEKLGHTKLDVFFSQWVYGAGCPRFRVSQRFNKKKLVVEMIIQQFQHETVDRDIEKDTFLRDVKEDIRGVFAGTIQPIFTGPMTIRIHEADGTPYEHIIEIKEATTKFDIPYNTKYKRLKRSRRQKERTAAAGMEFPIEGNDDVLLYCLGDILQSDEEARDWKLVEWTKEDEERMNQESYEWIRMDADFEWICKMNIQMPGYMFLSQLQQDRDVVAQLESVEFMAGQRENPLVSTILVRTLMDRRYFHGIRTAAAAALAKHAKEENNWIGLYHLEKAFQEFFCFQNSPMPRSNDFSDRAAYYIQCAIPKAIAKVRDVDGKAPLRVKKFLLDKLRLNDNSDNRFSDSHYIAVLLSALAETLSTRPAPLDNAFDDMNIDDDGGDDIIFHRECLDMIDRYRRMDELVPSYHNILSTTALNSKLKLIKAGATPLDTVDFLQYTSDGTCDILRVNAFTNMMELGMIKNNTILRWFLCVLSTDPSPYIRENMLQIFGKALGFIAIGETSPAVSAEIALPDGLIIEQDASTEARKADLARKQTVAGALSALKAEVGNNEVLKEKLWAAIASPIISLRELGQLLDICEMLYTPESSMVVVLKYPRYWKCTKTGKATLVFQKTNRIRTRPLPPRLIPPTSIPRPPPLKLKLQAQHPPPTGGARPQSTPKSNGSSNINSSTAAKPPTSASRPFLKPPKRILIVNSTAATTNSPSGLSSTSSTNVAVLANGANKSPPEPRLTLKLNMKGAGAGAGARGGGGAAAA